MCVSVGGGGMVKQVRGFLGIFIYDIVDVHVHETLKLFIVDE